MTSLSSRGKRDLAESERGMCGVGGEYTLEGPLHLS